MSNLNYSFLIIWAILFLKNIKENWKSIISATMFAVFTIIAINVAILFYPGFVEQYWNLNKLWPLFLNTPTEEIFFAGVMAATWMILPGYLMRKN